MRIKELFLFVTVVAIVLFSAACGSGETPPAESAPTAPPAPTDAPTDPPPTAASTATEATAAPTDTPSALTVGALRESAESESAEDETAESDPAPSPTPAAAEAIVSDAAQPLAYDISLPAGFQIHIYAAAVPNARSMALSPDGTLFVGTRSAGNVYAVLDQDGDYVADEVITLAQGMNSPNGVAFRDGALYVAEINRILRYDNIEAALNNPPDPVVVNDAFPSDVWHGWKFIAFGPDDKLYVPVGAPCNVCDTSDGLFGKITRMNPDGSGLEIFAEGMRNSVGFDWHPETGVLWWTDNGADNLGDDVPPDELNRSPEAGMHFGFPYCHGGTIPDPEFGAARACDEFTPPVQQLGPHVAALGMRFYTGDSFPAEYHNQIFIPEHGSWNRTDPIGYRVTLVRLDDNGDAASYEVFAAGWLAEDGTIHGRPVDLLVMPDGSLLVSDDEAGMIYRIVYTG